MSRYVNLLTMAIVQLYHCNLIVKECNLIGRYKCNILNAFVEKKNQYSGEKIVI